MFDASPVLWFTGLSGAGKTTIATEVRKRLSTAGVRTELLDGDEVRSTLSSDLGFSRAHRDLQVRRLGWVAGLLSRNQVLVLVSAISPYRETRSSVLRSLPKGLEIFVSAPLSVLEDRDTKGLYKRARQGEIQNFTGVDDPYEAPDSPSLHLDTSTEALEECVGKVLRMLSKECSIDVF